MNHEGFNPWRKRCLSHHPMTTVLALWLKPMYEHLETPMH